MSDTSQLCDLAISPKTVTLKWEEAPSIKFPERTVEMCKTMYCYNLGSAENSEVVIHRKLYIMVFLIKLTDRTTSSKGKVRLE